MDSLTPELRLPAILDSAAAPALVLELAALRGGALAVDGSNVSRLGGLCLQALMSARQTWAADGQPFEIRNLSTIFRETLALTGAEDLGTASS